MIDRITKLMALALNNPCIEEAQSAALKAVKLIAEHKVKLTLPAAAPQAPGPFTRAADERFARAVRMQHEDWIREMMKNMDDMFNDTWKQR